MVTRIGEVANSQVLPRYERDVSDEGVADCTRGRVRSSNLSTSKSFLAILLVGGCQKTNAAAHNCMAAVPKIIPKPVIIGFFLLGVLSSVAFRLIIIFQKTNPGWVRPTWYFGVLGYMAFFIYRYYISLRRKRVVAESGIIEKLRSGAVLSAEDREAALYLLISIQKSREDWNYLAIFILSAAAMAIDWCL